MKLRHRLITFKDDQQMILSDAPEEGITIEVALDNVPVVSNQVLDLPEEEIAEISKKTQTHKLKFDTIKKKMTLTQRKPVKSDSKGK